jgi:hypothetical protein
VNRPEIGGREFGQPPARASPAAHARVTTFRSPGRMLRKAFTLGGSSIQKVKILKKHNMRRVFAILVSGITFAGGLIISRVFFYAVGFGAPRLPEQAPEAIAGFYLIAGSLVLSIGLVLLAEGINTSFLVRWFLLDIFVFLGFAVSTTIEASIYSSATGMLSTIPVLLFPSTLATGVLSQILSPPARNWNIRKQISHFGDSRPLFEWGWRIVLAIVSFPVIYFIFGLIVAPIVTNYYANGVSGLALPSLSKIIQVQFIRSAIHLIAVVPIIVMWKGKRQHLVLALGLAFFVFVFAYDIVFAIQTPTVLIFVHGVEVLADSLVYASVLVSLLMVYKSPSLERSPPNPA